MRKPYNIETYFTCRNLIVSRDFKGEMAVRRLLIKNAQIITMNKQDDIFHGDVLIEGERIKEIGTNLQPDTVDAEIDARHQILLPGFIHTHIHLCQTLFRGQGDDWELMDWLKKRIWPLEAAHDEESIYYSAMLGIGELIKGGTTSIVDMETVHHTDFAFQAIQKSGIRALAGKVMMDHGEEVPKLLRETTSASLQESMHLYEKWHGKDGRIQYAFSPRFVVSCSEELLKEVALLSEKYQVCVHTHASENKDEIEIVEQERGMRNVVYLDHLGLANERLILAHCVWLDEEEKKIIRDRKVKVSHCPGSNLKLASGIAEVPHMLKSDMYVSLGADGAPCNNNLDMFQEMKLAALIQKPIHGPTSMKAKQVLQMATIGGAKALGLEHEIGSIEVGKKADLILVDLHKLHAFPSYDIDPISRIVYSAYSSDVETVIINGKIVMENRRLKTMDEDIILKEANKSSKRLIGKLPTIAY